ncbi:hypothetical protein QEN36_15270, partial [Gordonia alkanivorans]|nr:hypothetical protein [Gordonia alkanivorans]
MPARGHPSGRPRAAAGGLVADNADTAVLRRSTELRPPNVSDTLARMPGPARQLPFAIVMRGYDREQVADHLQRLDAELRVLAADRDAATANAHELASHLEEARDEIAELR